MMNANANANATEAEAAAQEIHDYYQGAPAPIPAGVLPAAFSVAVRARSTASVSRQGAEHAVGALP